MPISREETLARFRYRDDIGGFGNCEAIAFRERPHRIFDGSLNSAQRFRCLARE